MNKKKKKGTIKKILASFIALVLVVGLTIVGTLAYLGTTTNTTPNTFTGSKGISLKLTEPLFTSTKDSTTGKTGQEMAGSYSPGMTIPKNPLLTNNTENDGDANAKEWVAIAITYQYKYDSKYGSTSDKVTESGGDYLYKKYEDLKKIISPLLLNLSKTNITSTDDKVEPGGYWIPVANTESDGTPGLNKGYAIYMYSKPLAQNTSTEPLFQSVTILDKTTLISNGNTFDVAQSANNAAVDVDWETDLPGFRINVIGGAIKNEYYKNDPNDTDPTDGTDKILTTSVSDLGNGSGSNLETLKTNLANLLKEKLHANAKSYDS